MIGSPHVCRARHVAYTPMGRIAGPLTPPDRLPMSGSRREMSTTIPGKVLIALRPSAPASSQMRAKSPTSGTLGVSLITSGRSVQPRSRATRSASALSSVPNIVPPFTFGQETLISYPRKPSSPSSPLTTAAKSSAECPTTFTNTCARLRCSRSQGSFSAMKPCRPGFSRPIALIIPPGVSATRCGGFPGRGSRLTAFVTSPPISSRGMRSAYSCP